MKITITSFSVANFRSIHGKQTLLFDSSRNSCYALYGKNASGKSNILKALRVMVDIIIHSGDAGYSLPYDFFKCTDNTNLAPTEFEIGIKSDVCLLNYSFSYVSNGIVDEVLKVQSENSNKYKVLFFRSAKTIMNPAAANYGFSQSLLDRTLSKNLLINKAYGENNKFARLVFEAIGRIMFVSLDSMAAERRAAGILNQDQNTRIFVAKEIQKIEPDICSITTVDTHLYDDLLDDLNIDIGLKNKLRAEASTEIRIRRCFGVGTFDTSLKNESAGTRMIVVILTAMKYAADNELMLCIDEFGNYLHPFNASRMIEIYNKMQPVMPLLISTHIMQLYDYIGRAERIIVEKNPETGATTVQLRKPTISSRRDREDRKKAENNFQD